MTEPGTRGTQGAESPEPVGRVSEDYTERLLGRPLELRRREVSRGAEVSLLSARKFWHALGFPVVDTDDELFTEADQKALAAVAGIVAGRAARRADGARDDPAPSPGRPTVWQAGSRSSSPRPSRTHMSAVLADEADDDEHESRSVPSLETATETAKRLAVLTDRLEPLLVYAWRRHLSATVAPHARPTPTPSPTA